MSVDNLPWTLASTLAVGAAVTLMALRAWLWTARIRDQLEFVECAASQQPLRRGLRLPLQLPKSILSQLMQRGFDGLPEHDRRAALAMLLAEADVKRLRVTGLIELMPQLGFAGTVAGLIVNNVGGAETGSGGLSTALYTTAIGLCGYVVARLFIEPRADDAHTTVTRYVDILSATTTASPRAPLSPAVDP